LCRSQGRCVAREARDEEREWVWIHSTRASCTGSCADKVDFFVALIIIALGELLGRSRLLRRIDNYSTRVSCTGELRGGGKLGTDLYKDKLRTGQDAGDGVLDAMELSFDNCWEEAPRRVDRNSIRASCTGIMRGGSRSYHSI